MQPCESTTKTLESRSDQLRQSWHGAAVREHLRIKLRVGDTHVLREDAFEDRTQVGARRLIAAVLQRAGPQSNPLGVNRSARDGSAQQERGSAGAVIRTAAAVRFHRAAELGR